MKLTTLVDNHVTGSGLLAEHGLAMLIETGDEKILFDTGQGMALAPNCQRLGIDLSQVTKIVLSHGHYDHTAGLRAVLAAVDGVDLYAHPDVFQAKYHVTSERQRYIGMPFTREAVEGSGNRLHLRREPSEFIPGIWLTGEVPRQTDFERVDSRFHALDQGDLVPDLLWDDQSLIIETGEGITLLLGCAHAGIVNVFHAVERIRPGTPIVRVIGGTHLVQADERRLQATVSALIAHSPTEVAASHCTGRQATHVLREALGERLKPNDVGTVREL